MAERSKNNKYITITVAVWRDPNTGKLHVTGKDPLIRQLGLPGIHLRPKADSATERTLSELMDHVLQATSSLEQTPQ